MAFLDFLLRPANGRYRNAGHDPVADCCDDVMRVCSRVAQFVAQAAKVVASPFVASCNEGRRHSYIEIFNTEDWSVDKVKKFVCGLKKKDEDLFYFLIGKVTERHLFGGRVHDVVADVWAQHMPSDMERFEDFESYFQMPFGERYVSETIDRGRRYFLEHEMDPKVINVVRALSLWVACKSPRLE